MNQHYLKHIVSDSERWDNLAYRYYGDPLKVNLLIDANPHIPFCEQLPTGQIIWVPVLQVAQVDNSGMPPWMEADDNG